MCVPSQMETDMKIGIIGAGYIGRALTKHAMAAGHDVMLSNSRGPQTLHSFAAALQCKTGTAQQAAEFGEVVAVAVPFINREQLPVAALTGKTVIDPNNYYPDRDGHIAELDDRSTTTSEIMSRILPHSHVVKAFNAIFAADLEADGKPAGTPGRRALPIAGDNADAKRVVAGLQDSFGFDVVDAGALAESWRFERDKPGYCLPLDVAGWREALAAAERTVEMPVGTWHPSKPLSA